MSIENVARHLKLISSLHPLTKWDDLPEYIKAGFVEDAETVLSAWSPWRNPKIDDWERETPLFISMLDDEQNIWLRPVYTLLKAYSDP